MVLVSRVHGSQTVEHYKSMDTKEFLDYLEWFINYASNKLALVEKETGEKHEYYSSLISRLRRAMKNLDDGRNPVNKKTMNRILVEVETINDDLGDIVRKHNKTLNMIQD